MRYIFSLLLFLWLILFPHRVLADFSPITTINIGVIIVKFGDSTTVPDNASVQNTIFGAGANSIKSFYETNSYHKAVVSGNVIGPVSIPMYSAADVCYTNISVFQEFASEAKQQAQNQGANLSTYNHFIYYFLNPSNSCAAGGWAFGDSVFIRNNDTGPILTNHEFGHTFGLSHADILSCPNGKAIDTEANCTLLDTADHYDIMGWPTADPETNFAHELNAPNKIYLGWIPVTQVQTITQSGTYTISPLESTTNAVQVLKIHKADTNTAYYVEYRRPIGYDASFNPHEGALIHIWNENNPTDVTKLICPTGAAPPCNFGFMNDGMTFTDSINEVSIKQISHDANNATIQVTMGSTSNLIGDMDKNNKVDIADFLRMVQLLHTNIAVADLNNDGKTNIFDFNILIRNYGRSE